MRRGSEAPEKRDRVESDEGGARENKISPKFFEMQPSEQRTRGRGRDERLVARRDM